MTLIEGSSVGGAETEAVLLVVSELVTNAVQHAGGVTGFGLRAGPGTVTVPWRTPAACLRGCCRPIRRGRAGGLSWHLVQDLAQDVAVSIGAGGKAVSAVLPLAH